MYLKMKVNMSNIKIEKHDYGTIIDGNFLRLREKSKKKGEMRQNKLGTWNKKLHEKVGKLLINMVNGIRVREKEERVDFEKKNKICDLPLELKNSIANYLLYEEILCLSKVSIDMYEIVDKNEQYWREYFNIENENNKKSHRKAKYISTKNQNYRTIKEYNKENITNFLSFYQLVNYYKNIDTSFETCSYGSDIYILPHKGTRFVVSNGLYYENYVIYDVTTKKKILNQIEQETKKYSEKYSKRDSIKFKAYRISDDGKILSKRLNGSLKNNTTWKIYIKKNYGIFVNIDNNNFGCICKKGFIVDNYLDTPFIHNRIFYQKIGIFRVEKLSEGLTIYLTTRNINYYNYYMYYVHHISILNNIVIEAIIKHIPVNSSFQEHDMKIVLRQGKWVIEENKIDNGEINVRFGCYYIEK